MGHAASTAFINSIKFDLLPRDGRYRAYRQKHVSEIGPFGAEVHANYFRRKLVINTGQQIYIFVLYSIQAYTYPLVLGGTLSWVGFLWPKYLVIRFKKVFYAQFVQMFKSGQTFKRPNSKVSRPWWCQCILWPPGQMIILDWNTLEKELQ